MIASAPKKRRTIAPDLTMNCEPADNIAEVLAQPGDWIMEPKYNGWRVMVYIGENEVDILTRRGKRQTGKTPRIDVDLLGFFPAGTILDAELVSLTLVDGKPVEDYPWVQQVMLSNPEVAIRKQRVANQWLSLVIFDVRQYGDTDLQFQPLRHRLEYLEGLEPTENVMTTMRVPPTQANHDGLVALGFEGTVTKDLSSPYYPGIRSMAWRKVKETVTVEGVVMDTVESKRHPGKVGSLAFGQYNADGVLVRRGNCAGLTQAMLSQLNRNPEHFIGTVIEVRHMGVQADHIHLRHPVFMALRPDKDPAQVTWHNR